jgi:CRP-like cAMP-binding protein
MAEQRPAFNPKIFLSTVGAGREMMSFQSGQTVYAQGDAADALFVIQNGKVKLSVKSKAGKEATLDILSDDDFVGKDAIAGQQPAANREAGHDARTDTAGKIGESVFGICAGEVHSLPAGHR